MCPKKMGKSVRQRTKESLALSLYNSFGLVVYVGYRTQ
jgi:hypothetical protein